VSSERYYWRSDPGAEPMLLPPGWEQHIKGDEPPGSRLARFLKRRLMKNEAADRYFEAERLSKRALADQRTLPAARAAGSRIRHVPVTAARDTGATINDDPILIMTIELDGTQRDLVALVPRIAIPRAGETITVLESPDRRSVIYADYPR